MKINKALPDHSATSPGSNKPSPLGCMAVRKNGMTLVLVLGLVALCTILVVAFLTLMSAELVSSKAASNETTATQLATTAVQLVQGTIIHATEPRTSTGVPDTGQAWACQPGMIRTYGMANAGSQTTASSSPLAYYKLYSAQNMIVSGSSLTSYNVDGDIVQAWDAAPSLFTDLNAPLNLGTTIAPTNLFPIADPRAADSDIAVQGFSYGNTTTMSGTTVNGVVNGTLASTSDTTSRLPMPVRWLYVLQDGTLTAPGGTTTASWTSGTPSSTTGEYPMATNAIVGRIAFWTDDECNKVNINTASEGTFADTPVCNASNSAPVLPATPSLGGSFGATNSYCGELALATYPGVQKEYQRYPGHPATTCLSTVLGNYLGSGLTHDQLVRSITDVVPRVSEYSTASGSTPASSLGGTVSFALASASPPAVAPDMDRLYSSVDEFAFKAPTSVAANRTGQAFSTGTTASTLPIAQTCRFFLTANSKAPELNLFGLPRVAMWPVWDDKYAASRTTLDNEILRCATVATNAASGKVHPMIFSREDSTSSTVDWTTATLAGETTTPRNQELYGYLQALTSRPVPGYANSSTDTFATKYAGSDRDQILTEIFDYIRCTNIQDLSSGAFSYTGSYLTTGATDSAQQNPTQSPKAPGNAPGQVLPIRFTSEPNGDSYTTQGFGRMPMVAELALILTKVDDRKTLGSAVESTGNLVTTVNVTGGGIPSGWTSAPVIPSSYSPTSGTLVEWALMPKIDGVAAGWAGIAENIRLKFNVNLTFQDSGGGTGTVTAASPNIPDVWTGAAGGTSPATGVGGVLSTDRDNVIGGLMGCEALIDCNKSAMGTTATSSMLPTGLYYAHAPSTVAGGAGLIIVSGSVTIQVYAGATAASPGTLVQTLNFNFPAGTGTHPLQSPLPNVYVQNQVLSYGWAGTFRVDNSTSVYSVAGSTGTFNYPSIWQGAAYGSKANRNSSWRIDGLGADRVWLGGGVSTQTGAVGGTSSDVVHSLIPGGTLGSGAGNNYAGDLRVLAITNNVPSTAFIPGASLTATTGTTTKPQQKADYAADSLRVGMNYAAPGCATGNLITNSNSYVCEIPYATYSGAAAIDNSTVYNLLNGVTMPNDGSVPGDWDTGEGLMIDGPWINKPDEGVTAGSEIPYIMDYQAIQASGAQFPGLFSPNRIVSSPVMFGSLLAGADHPWRTLLFRPPALPGYNPTNIGTTYTHPGYSAPGTTLPDHLLLDMFWMPVVEPYGISEPLATAGKINLNYQIAPFTYINRSTGMQAILKSVMITALNPSPSGTLTGAGWTANFGNSSTYKFSVSGSGYSFGRLKTATTRWAIDPVATLNQLLIQANAPTYDSTSLVPEFTRPTHSNAQPNFFVSASKICDVPLVPAVPSSLSGPYTAAVGTTTGNLQNFWKVNALTGDNELERPYTYIYPRVTTQSNVFTVHVRAQSLKQVPTDLTAGAWTEGTDLVTGEYRGSFVIEKYLDPDNANITDGSTTPTTAASDATIDTTSCMRGAKWRVLSNKRFGQ